MLKLQYPQGTSTCYYGYDAAQRLTQLRSAANHACYYTFDASGNVTQRTLGNGVVSWASFDKTDRMVSLRYTKSDGTALAYYDYGRDVAGRIVRIGRDETAGYAIYYSYDLLDREAEEDWRKLSDNSQIYAFTYSYDG